jgi:hypothetical protein
MLYHTPPMDRELPLCVRKHARPSRAAAGVPAHAVARCVYTFQVCHVCPGTAPRRCCLGSHVLMDVFMCSDPWWKKQHAKRRMITATALDLYVQQTWRCPTNQDCVGMATATRTLPLCICRIGARMEASGGVLLVRTDQEVVVEQAVASFAAAQHPWRHAAQAGMLQPLPH